MTAPNIGLTITRNETGPVPGPGADFTKVLAIETSADASPTEFPVDTAKRFSSGETDAMTALGGGLLYDAVKGAHDQVAPLGLSLDVTVVRVEEGADVAATAANIVNITDGLRDIPSAVNATPRIVLAGRTAWRPDLDTTNPVVASLQANLGSISAIAPVDVDDTDEAVAVDARETMSSERLMPVGVAARVFEGSTLVTRPMAPRVGGLFARVDMQHGGYPFDPIANNPIYGISGVSRKIPFSLFDGATEGQRLLENEVSIVVEGETGVDGAIADGGYIFLGLDNTKTGDIWKQIHQVRGLDFISVQATQITRQYLGNRKITADLVEDWMTSLQFALRDHKAAGRIIGYSPRKDMFRPDRNSPENIRLGHLTLSVGIETAPAFRRATIEIEPYRPALEGLVQDIVAAANAGF